MGVHDSAGGIVIVTSVFHDEIKMTDRMLMLGGDGIGSNIPMGFCGSLARWDET
jgi:hypothetical protein